MAYDFEFGQPPEDHILDKNITNFNIARNRFRILPKSLEFTRVENLIVSNNAIETFPNLPDTVKEIHFGYNLIGGRGSFGGCKFPAFSNLVKLFINNNRIQVLPDQLWVDTLEELDISNNFIGKIPDRHSPVLRRFIASNNRLRVVPDDIPASMVEYRIDINNIARLPDSLVNCGRLEQINYENNVVLVAGGQGPGRGMTRVGGRNAQQPQQPPVLIAVSEAVLQFIDNRMEIVRMTGEINRAVAAVQRIRDRSNLPDVARALEDAFAAQAAVNGIRGADEHVLRFVADQHRRALDAQHTAELLMPPRENYGLHYDDVVVGAGRRPRIPKTIYSDSQSVHASPITKEVKTTLEKLCAEFGGGEYNGVLQQYLDEVVVVVNSSRGILKKLFAKNHGKELRDSLVTLFELSGTQSHSALGLTLSDVFVVVWNRARKLDHDAQKTIVGIMQSEIGEMRSVCYTGRISRLVNLLSGFCQDVGVHIDLASQIQAKYAVVKAWLKRRGFTEENAVYAHVFSARFRRLLEEIEIPADIIAEWLSAFTLDDLTQEQRDTVEELIAADVDSGGTGTVVPPFLPPAANAASGAGASGAAGAADTADLSEVTPLLS